MQQVAVQALTYQRLRRKTGGVRESEWAGWGLEVEGGVGVTNWSAGSTKQQTVERDQRLGEGGKPKRRRVPDEGRQGQRVKPSAPRGGGGWGGR